MRTNQRTARAFRYLLAAVGIVLGLVDAVQGLRALFVSRGNVTDWILISGVFFVTLPASAFGCFVPCVAGWAMIGAGALATVALGIQDAETVPSVLRLYTGPTMLVGAGLVIMRAIEEHHARHDAGVAAASGVGSAKAK
jgi:disulfide bond formation protein DsbB